MIPSTLLKDIKDVKLRSEVRRIAIKFDEKISVPEVTAAWEQYQGERAKWVLSEFCEGIVGNMENCDEYLIKFKKEEERDNNIVAVQKMAYGSCLGLLKKLKKDYDDDALKE